jgi:trk system potassium uptake protein
MSLVKLYSQLLRISFWISLSGIILLIANIGFLQTFQSQQFFNFVFYIVIICGIIATIFRFFLKPERLKKRAVVFDILSVLLSVAIIYWRLVGSSFASHWFSANLWLKLAVILAFIREFSEVEINYKRTIFNPAQLFIISFLMIIVMGSLLLLLPSATVTKISFIDALFTSTSAVCVTGLIVLDTATDFTLIGKSIIMLLIQVGGLGILTFASYFSYFFRGVSTYENQLALSDMTSSNKLGEVFSLLKSIILITVTIESFSAFMLFLSSDASQFKDSYDHWFFIIFHSVSAFCNAGFSTLSDGLFDVNYRVNYAFQLSIIFCFVLGGLGFPILSNIFNYIRYQFVNILSRYQNKRFYRPWMLNLNSRITLITTLSITLIGFLLFYAIEKNNSLAHHTGAGKFIAALFGATTPRTAGFNTIDNSMLSTPAIMLIILLMWIGASPLSTGGGIKTSTFAIAILNILSLAKGKTRIEIFRREIADVSVRRAFAIIFLSLLIIGIGIILLSFTDNDKPFISLAFECFSAYSTVGLSLGITSSLSVWGKIVIIFLMFIGRVSMLSIVIALFRKERYKNYKYPTEEITIN